MRLRDQVEPRPAPAKGLSGVWRAAVLIAAMAMTLALGIAAQAYASTDSGIVQGSAITLPTGHGQYFFVGSTAGDQPMASISWLETQDLAVNAFGGQGISIGHSATRTGSYTSSAAQEAIASVGLDGDTVVQTFSAQASKPAHKATRHPEKPLNGPSATLSFKTTEANQQVLILAGGQGTGTLALSGIEAITLQNATYGSTGSATLASTAAYTATLAPGKHKVKVRSTTYAPNSGTTLGAVAYVLAPAPAPTITSVTPNTGPQVGGTSVTITGTNLDGATTVKFGSTDAQSFKVNSPTSIEATSPTGSGTVDVTATTERGTSSASSADLFSYAPPPSVSSISPNNGPQAGGTSVTITGTNLDGATAVKFGSADAQSFKVNSPTSIEATSPAGNGTVDVTVSTAFGTSAANPGDAFVYVPPPSVSNVSPNNGPQAGGTSVTITGSSLAGATSVKFGSSNASFKVNSPTSIEATAPGGSGTVDVTVSTPFGTSTTSPSDQFTYVPPPPSITASKGGPYRGGFELRIQVHNFPLGTFVYQCHDNSGPGGSDTVYFSHAVEVVDPNQSTWPGVFCFDSAPFVSYLVMDGVRSNSVQF